MAEQVSAVADEQELRPTGGQSGYAGSEFSSPTTRARIVIERYP